MGRYGHGMRDCCDSFASDGHPHIKGCVHATEDSPAHYLMQSVHEMTTTPYPVEVMQAANYYTSEWYGGSEERSASFIKMRKLFARALMAERARITDKLYLAAIDGKSAFEAWEDLK